MLADHYQSKTNSVSTPQYLLDLLKNEFGPMFDPCPFNPHFDKNKDIDGLDIPWKKTNYCNPPYNFPKPWVVKAKREQRKGNTTILLLKLSCLGTQYIKRLLKLENKNYNYSRENRVGCFVTICKNLGVVSFGALG